MNTLAYLGRLLITVIVITGFAAVPGIGSDTATLEKQIYKEIKQAERMMFSGKKAQADVLLKQVAEKLTSLENSTPASKKLTTLNNQYNRTRKNLDKRMGKSSSTSPSKVSKTGQTSPPKRTSSSKTGSKRPDYKTQMMVKNVKKVIKDVDYELGRARQSIEPETASHSLPRSAAEKTKEAESYITRAEGHIQKAEQKYNNIPTDLQTQLAEAKTKIAQVRNEVKTWETGAEAKEAAEAKAGQATAAQKAKSIEMLEQDAARMLALYQQYFKKFESIHGRSLVYSMKLEDAEKALTIIREAEKTIPQFAAELGKLADKYGSKSMNIYNNFHKQGYKLQNSEDNKIVQLIEALSKVASSRKASADTLANYAQTLLEAFTNQFNDARLARMDEAKKLLKVGYQFDPQNDKIQQMLADIDKQITAAADKMKAQIDAATWAGNIKSFSGPGSVKKLAAEAKKYFENDRAWGKKPGSQVKILAVSIRGPWKVAEADIFGRVIRWRLPIHVAVTDEKLKPRNIARVYDLSIVAMQGAPAKSPQNPPFDGFWVGASWMMRLDKFREL